MKNDDPHPKTQPSGNKPPPRPPRRIAVGLGPDGDDSDKKRRATITKVAYGEGKFIRQSGGRGQHGHVKIKIEPNKRDKGVEVIIDVSSDAIPIKYIKSVTDGVREALYAICGGMLIANPAFERHPMVDIIVHVVDGSFDETDSSDIAFKMAAIFASKDAMKKADPIIIE
jgi:elongation factor G